jgi:regulatory protein
LAARPKAPRSLKSRALQLLAQRDQSRVELRRKLLRHLRAADVARDDDAPRDGEPEVEALLDWLEANHFLSDARFVESRVHAREARFGNLRIRSELAQHGVSPSDETAQALAESELARAAAVRERRFAALPSDAAERAAQCRFLSGRGFSPEVVHRLMRRLRDGPSGTGSGEAQAD